MADSTPTATSSEGVDLYELERLRVLVRFEFDREVTQDELAAALTRCHNNTREAYHFLKEQRRQAQLAATAAMVAAATATIHPSAGAVVNPPATATATATPPSSNGTSNGAKRRSESDADEDVKMDTPNKRQRAIEFVTVDLSQLEEMTQPTQLPDKGASPCDLHVGHDRAGRVISNVVSKLMQADHASTDNAQWLSTAVEALAVSRVPELDRHLAVVVEALANALKHVAASDVPSVRSDAVELILDVLLQLPRKDQYDVELRLKPSDDVLNKEVGDVDNSFSYALSDQLTKLQRSQAAKNAISVIVSACASCITRQESIHESVHSAQSHRRRVRARINDLKKIVHSRLEQAAGSVKTSEREMDEALQDRASRSLALMNMVEQQTEVFRAQGEDIVDATLEAHRSILLSKSPDVVQLREDRDEKQLLYKARQQDVIRANTLLEFCQKLEALRLSVVPHVLRWLDVSAKRADSLKVAAERAVEEKLTQYVSKMTHVLRLYYDYHTIRQQLATKDREKQRQSLEEHNEFYDGLVPSAKKEIENKIQEFNGVIVHSTQLVREVASLQSNLWDGKRKLFSPAMFLHLENEYSKLWNSLSGGARDMMADCVRVIRDQPAAAPTVPSPVLVSANVRVEPTVTPYEFVRREHDSRQPQLVRGTPLTPPESPFVDLTGDEDGDDAMNGSMGARFEFGAPSTRFVPANDSEAELPSFKQEGQIHPETPNTAREFPVGARLCWVLKDEQEGFEATFTGFVKRRTEADSYVLEDENGHEHTIPAENLYTEKDMATFQTEQGMNDDKSRREGCTVM